ncbi:hypothetical protein [Marivita hallyeonensis]|uniref:Uncharacterized protein n=1 Tax=Marivita hallyeonensis TaxID=996342 RepID=A0A1M5WY52_9RHOB|nr:hypothetical protein [Marivita hallyeonensis]SHH92487.1 hypothetical protein SAMN05443551_3594 [Marivita hallyeonensis]
MLGKLFGTLVKFTFYALGTVAVIGVWDFTREAEAARLTPEPDYTMERYVASLTDRYGDDVQAATEVALETAKTGLTAGLEWAQNTGAIEKLGIEEHAKSLQMLIAPQAEPAIEAAIATEGAVVQMASAAGHLAPETSLLPRARVTQ